MTPALVPAHAPLPVLARLVAGVAIAFALASCGRTSGESRNALSRDGLAAERVAVVEGFAAPEGVRWDPEQDVYFVSNFNGAEDGDSNGFISRVSADGVVEAREFMTGSDQHPMHAPRGMFLAGDTLWAADAGGVHGFDRRSGKALAFVDLSRFAPGFLNDLASGPDGALYATDTGRPRLFRIRGGAGTQVDCDSLPAAPNGIAWDEADARFVLASWTRGASLYAWTPGTREFTPVGAPGPGGFDGVERIGQAWWVASQSDSSLHVIDASGERIGLRLAAGPADFAVDRKRGRVAVPMMDLNRVEIWRLPAPGR